MAPELFEIGGITVRGYGLCIGIGILLMTWVVQSESKRIDLPKLGDVWVVILLAFVVAAFVGGKIAFWFSNPERARELLDQQGWGPFLREGFVFYGSLALCVPTGWLLLKAYKLPVMRSLDVVFLALPLLHAAGRMGCLFAGCCYGCTTDSGFSLVFERGRGLNGVPLLPIQLLEAGAELCVFLFLWLWLRKHKRYDGQIVVVWLILYAVMRVATEQFRGDGNPVLIPFRDGEHEPGMAPLGLTLSQVTAIGLFALALPVHLFQLRRHPRAEPAAVA